MSYAVQVMVVDDAYDARAIVRSILVSAGVSRKLIVVLDCGLTAIEILRTNPVDILFLDINMPVIDGITTAKIIKKNFPGLKIIGVSSNDPSDIKPIIADMSCKETKLEGYRMHMVPCVNDSVLDSVPDADVFDDYVQKPFSRAQFERVLRKFFRAKSDAVSMDDFML